MPLLLTPTTPFHTDSLLPVEQVYAVIRKVGYDTDSLRIELSVGYYTTEAARVARAQTLSIDALPIRFQQDATPEQVNGLPIFDFLDSLVKMQLEALHPTALIERVA
ncbi:hypothetical protein [Hymenobacter psychrophilus]|uniref:Uncharacterized protein n=1 Tax=Hymenobacter psychrophilus TaxID=651662 RepID=A0A1H3PI64_9BACT|nr:hypothetical protein [Hymenobacter psychrophilus]SDZ00688.1 hypothetical protein SAMN04488069_1333 [Hymenobacter psychrophilus]